MTATTTGTTTTGISTAIADEVTMIATTAGSTVTAMTGVSAEIVTAMTADIMQRRDTTTGRVTMPRSITGHVTVSSASSTAITGRGTAIAGAATTEAAHSTSTSKRGIVTRPVVVS